MVSRGTLIADGAARPLTNDEIDGAYLLMGLAPPGWPTLDEYNVEY